MKSGIYYIECLVNNKKYVGSAQDLHGRKVEHFKKLRIGTNNSLLQSDFNKYGENNFQFVVIEELSNDDELLINRENYYMDIFKTLVREYGYDYGYNWNRANRVRPTEETKKKTSESLKGKNIGLTLEQCFEIKDLLLENDYHELKKVKEEKVANLYDISKKTIRKIIQGTYWCSDQLGGNYKDWVNESNNEFIEKIKSKIKELNFSIDKVSEIDKLIKNEFNISQRTAQRIRLGDNSVTLRK